MLFFETGILKNTVVILIHITNIVIIETIIVLLKMPKIEEAYSIVKSQHKTNTNRYTFRYNHQWRNILTPLEIGIRSIKLCIAPRFFWINGLSLSNGTKSFNISPSFIFKTMHDFNECMKNDIKRHVELYKETLSINDYDIYYNPISHNIVFEITTTNNMYFTVDNNSTVSEDFTAITKCSRLIDGETTVYGNGYTKIVFHNVWNRDDVIVRASFVDLSSDNFLGVSNESFHPVKKYPVVFGDQQFWIELYDNLNQPIELPSDNRDTLIVEAQMIS